MTAVLVFVRRQTSEHSVILMLKSEKHVQSFASTSTHSVQTEASIRMLCLPWLIVTMIRYYSLIFAVALPLSMSVINYRQNNLKSAAPSLPANNQDRPLYSADYMS